MCKRALMRVWKTADTVQELKDLIGDDIVISDSYKGQTIKPDQCLCCVDMEATAKLHNFDSEIIDNDFWFKTWAIDRTNAANNVQGTGRGFNQLVRAEIVRVADKIEELEAQQEPADEWADSRMFVQEILADSSFPQRLIWLARYARHLEVNVADLDNELRCERIDGGKVRDDQKAILADRNRQKLAELTTIANEIPPACGLARELVEKRIEGVKKEMQGNG